jgi:ABC-type oligopeptide transport system ATPase subunit
VAGIELMIAEGAHTVILQWLDAWENWVSERTDRPSAESDPVEQILEHPADPYTIRLMEDVPKLRSS